MLSPYISQYIQLIKDEAELYEWAEKNLPSGIDLESSLESLINSYSTSSYTAVFCSSKVLMDVIKNNEGSYHFSLALLGESWFNYRNTLYQWITEMSDESEQEKACLYLAKTVNRIVLEEKDVFGLNKGGTFNSLSGFDSDINSLPLKQMFLKTKKAVRFEISKSSIMSFADFYRNISYFGKHNVDWDGSINKEELLKFILAPFQMGNYCVQITPYSYTSVANLELKETQKDGVSIPDSVVYFEQGQVKATNEKIDDVREKHDKLEQYALDIQKSSLYSVLDLDIDIMLDRLTSAVELNSLFIRDRVNSKKSLSYKLVFSISEQKTVVVPSVDMYQSLLYLKSMGQKEMSLYYDADKKRIVIKGETIKTKEEFYVKDGRYGKKEVQEFEIPTFAIIYEQPLSDLTSFTGIEYVEFFNPNLTFKDKYDKLNTVRNKPIELPQDFITEYPSVAATYEQQHLVALSNKPSSEKYTYVTKLIEAYLDSYTEVVEREILDKAGKSTGEMEIVRQTVPTKEWSNPDYILKVNEAYWKYNYHLSVEEILAYFISKGNKAGFRLLSMKILGVDYHLFEQQIIDALLETNDVFVSKLSIDEDNITADIKYEAKNDFISGNIYKKENELTKAVNSPYLKALNVFYGQDYGTEIYNNAASTLEVAKSDRYVPSLLPKVTDKRLAKELELNIDIFSPIFFQGVRMATTGSGEADTLRTNLLSTGKEITDLNLKIGDSSPDKSGSYEFGHFELFERWLQRQPSDAIIGGYSVSEIVDNYVFPKPNNTYIFSYILSKYRDKDDNIVGIRTTDNKNYGTPLNNILKADQDTRELFVRLGYTQSASKVTEEEAKEIEKKVKAIFKERYWTVRKEGRRLFNEFLKKGLLEESRKLVDEVWNEYFNNYSKPDLSKVPIFPSHNFKFGSRSADREFNLMEAQVEGVRHIASRKNSGLLLHEVGFGKTTSSITAISSMMNTGEASRVLFVVPKAVYDKFQDEIVGNEEMYGLLPNVNIVLLGNLSKPILIPKSKKAKKIKNYTDAEIKIIDEFTKFKKEFNKMLKNLSMKRVTFPNDPAYLSSSSWEVFYSSVKKKLSTFIPKWDNTKTLEDHIKYLETIYQNHKLRWDEVYEEAQNVINSSSSTEKIKKAAEKRIPKEAESIAKNLMEALKNYITLVDISLIDDLGEYTPETMKEKTILLVQHNAASKRIRPDKQSVLRALMFQEGMGLPNEEVKTLDILEWQSLTGLPKTKIKRAIKVLTQRPISLNRLNIDAVVVDEIHNFNNLVSRAGAKAMGIGSKRYYNSSTGKTRGSADTYFGLFSHFGSNFTSVRTSTKELHAMRYDSTNKASSDSEGGRLTISSICFEMQYKKPDSKNVILLSATPFTDSAYQVMSVLGMANYQMLYDNGIKDSWDFFNTYIDEVYAMQIRHDGDYGLFPDINNYYNDKALSNLITNVSNVKITDERIEASRPKKAIIPANKLVSVDGNKSESILETAQMGDWFRELEFVNSRVELSDNQKKFYKIILDYLEDDSKQMKLHELFPINESRTSNKDDNSLNEAIQEIVDDKFREAAEDPENVDLVINYLQGLYDRGQYSQHPILKEGIIKIRNKVLKEKKADIEAEFEDEDTVEAAIDNSQLSSSNKLKGKAIRAQGAQQRLVVSPYFLKLGDPKYTTPLLPSLEKDPVKTFVEQSPKLMFVVNSIKQTIEHQKKQVANGEIDKVGGQVIYFNTHEFEYGGKKYNAFDLLSEYIAKYVDAVSDEQLENGEYKEIAIISGKTRDENKYTKDGNLVERGRKGIKDSFNQGDVKVLIGSQAIKEGIDLQGNATTMYICEAEFSPEVAMQLEGRIWRQKNPYDVVRIVYVLAVDTIDGFIYSKINQKVNTIKNMLEKGVYEMGKTQFVLDTKQMLMSLMSNPAKLAEIEYNDRRKELLERYDTLNKELGMLNKAKNQYEEIEMTWQPILTSITKIYDNLRLAKEEVTKNSTELRKIIKKEKALIRQADYDKSGYKGDIQKWIEDPKSGYDKSKYEITQKELDETYEKLLAEKPQTNPFTKLAAPLTMETQYTQMEMVINKVLKNLKKFGHQFEQSWRQMNEDEQKEMRAKKGKSLSQAYFLAYYDVTEKLDLFGYTSKVESTITGNLDSVGIVDTYQRYIKNSEDNLTFDDLDKIIEKTEERFHEIKTTLADVPAYKAKLRENWVKQLAQRKIDYDTTVESAVDSMSKSLPLLKLRTQEQKEKILSGK